MRILLEQTLHFLNKMLRFDGKVALVTGAGGGLGKEYALAFGERGAKVVVNDLGGDARGGGKSSRPADVVVEEIRAKGGTAVANYDSVENGEKLIQTALDNFGRIDIVVNNAGILRDRSLARTSDEDWDIIHRVHLRGSFMVTRAAWPHMKKNGYGRIIMTSSAAGIYGNFGQANYSAAKLGLLGLSNTVAIEGQKYNIKCNTIAPLAGTRLLATVTTEEVQAALKPQYVAPSVLWLCHEDCEETGGCFEVGGGWASKLRWQRTEGKMLNFNTMTPEDVRNNWDEITNFNNATYPDSGAGQTTMKVLQLQKELENDVPKVSPNRTSAIDPDKAIGAKTNETRATYGDREVMLYALGVGVSTKQADHLKFLFEMHEDFCVLPTFIVQTAMQSNILGVPGLSIDPTQILHGEQYLELFQPLATSDTVHSRGYVADVLDKGKGALILLNVETFNEKNEKIAFNQTGIYVQRAGGFGGKRSSDKQVLPQDAPKRAPDASLKEVTTIDQAALYRLHGDRNPLHIDPSFAAMGGFSKPILHGLCSFGYAVRHVLQQYADNDVTKFKSVKVRFSRTVLPGQTIQTDMWKEGNRVYFQCKTAETGETCLSGAYVDLHDPPSSTQTQAAASPSSGLQSEVIFAEMGKRVNGNKETAKKLNAIISYVITKNKKPAKTWTLDMKKGKAELYEGESRSGKADLIMTMEDADFADMITGKLDGQKAFMTGKLKAKGNLMLAQKLGSVLKDNAKL